MRIHSNKFRTAATKVAAVGAAVTSTALVPVAAFAQNATDYTELSTRTAGESSALKSFVQSQAFGPVGIVLVLVAVGIVIALFKRGK